MYESYMNINFRGDSYEVTIEDKSMTEDKVFIILEDKYDSLATVNKRYMHIIKATSLFDAVRKAITYVFGDELDNKGYIEFKVVDASGGEYIVTVERH